MKDEVMTKEEARRKLAKYLNKSPLKTRPYATPSQKPKPIAEK
jgi:hypothetical protein